MADQAARPGAGAALRAVLPDAATLATRLDRVGYLADPGLATALFLAARLPQPVLLEGEPGVGKTQAATSLARALGTELVRLQCHDGITAAEALYEWNYPRQLLAIRLAEASGQELAAGDLFTADFLIRRPLLRALDHPGPLPVVLLIDEVDRADDEFEAFLFELLAENAVTVPELGTVRAAVPPLVVLTSNRTRDLHDALKRRCLHHWIPFPPVPTVAEIVRRRVPDAEPQLAAQAGAAIARLRLLDLQKPPGVAEAIDWVAALRLLGVGDLAGPGVADTLGVVLKYPEDRELALAEPARWLPS